MKKYLAKKWSKIDAEILKTVAHARQKFTITTNDRTLLLNAARQILLEAVKLENTPKKDARKIETLTLTTFPSFVFVTLFEREETVLCLGSTLQDNNLLMTVKNIVKKIISFVPKKRLNVNQYFEIELLCDEKRLTKKNFNPGLYAIHLCGTNYYFKSSIIIRNDWNLDELIHHLYEKNEIDIDIKNVSIFKTITFREYIFSHSQFPPLQDLYRYNELCLPSEITKKKLMRCLDNGQKYLKRALINKKIIYNYNPVTKKQISPNSISEWIRTFASIWALLETSSGLNINPFRNIIKNYDSTKLFGVVEIGTSALLAICEQLFKKYDATIEYPSRASFLLNFLKSDGSFYTFYKNGKYYKGDEHQYFLPYMAMIALLRESENTQYLEKITNVSLPYYLNFYNKSKPRQQLAMSMWLCRVLLEIYQCKQDRAYAEKIFDICDYLLTLQNYPLDENVDLLGSFTDNITTCTSSVILETLSIGLTLALKIDKTRLEKYMEAIFLGLRFILQMQYTKNNCFDKFLQGGFRFSPFNQEIRIDVIQHAIFAIKNTLLHQDF